ncbi:hypothetical protein Bca52824_007556 [Brassica carinata]|uniref:MSP domain-containing protein n=1 Tax=Brassica carinata TaxID=52824 RepID=A0A8X7W6F9_BRACI|nr:hypothetical protein Bca52824_007556 [Brassica carinata]
MSNELLDIDPIDLQFPFELKKQISSSLYLANKTDDYVAFKVKTTNPKKYCVRPNTGVVLPRSSSEVLVTMQAQKEAPADMQCKDKFLLQCVVASPGATAKEVTPEMAPRFSVDRLEPQENSSEEQLKRESKRSQSGGGIPFMYVLLVGLIGLILGYIMKRT